MALVIFIILCVVVMAGAGIGTNMLLGSKANPAIEKKPKLSEVAKQLVWEYNSLPEDNRPFPDIEDLVRALDERTNADSVDRRNHFNENWLASLNKELHASRFEFTWKNTHGVYPCVHRQSRTCKYHDYYRLHVAIQEVADTIKEKERAILEAKTQDAVDSIKELEDRLRDEAGLNRTFTQTYKELS